MHFMQENSYLTVLIIYKIFLKWQSYGNGEQMNVLLSIVRRLGREGHRCGHEIQTQATCGDEDFYILTLYADNIVISWC